MQKLKTQVHPSVSTPNLAGIQRDIEITIEDLKMAYDNEKCYHEACIRAVREFSDMMSIEKLESYAQAISKSEKKLQSLRNDILIHEKYLIDIIIEKI